MNILSDAAQYDQSTNQTVTQSGEHTWVAFLIRKDITHQHVARVADGLHLAGWVTSSTGLWLACTGTSSSERKKLSCLISSLFSYKPSVAFFFFALTVNCHCHPFVPTKGLFCHSQNHSIGRASSSVLTPNRLSFTHKSQMHYYRQAVIHIIIVTEEGTPTQPIATKAAFQHLTQTQVWGQGANANFLKADLSFHCNEKGSPALYHG